MDLNLPVRLLRTRSLHVVITRVQENSLSKKIMDGKVTQGQELGERWIFGFEKCFFVIITES